MPGKALVLVFCIILMFILTIYCLEFFIPIKLKIDFNDYCRQSLIKVENNGGMTLSIETDLTGKLNSTGFKNIQIICDTNIKKGNDINFIVNAQYERKHFIELFRRENIVDNFKYNKTTVSRKVVN